MAAHKHRGFTLIEVLVAIGVMALMALMAWRGLDGMLRTQSSLQTRADDVRTLQAGLAQWQTDLDQLAELPGTPSWDWNGQVLRLTRRSADAPLTEAGAPSSVRVVAWTWRVNPGRPGGGDWERWQSSPLTQRSAWQTAWNLAQQWGQTPDDSTRSGQVQIHPLAGWQLYVHRGGSWTNPLSSDVVGPTVNAGIAGNAGTGNNAGTATAYAANPAGSLPGNTSINTNTSVNAAQSGTTPDGVRLVLRLPPGPVGEGLLSWDWVRPTLTGAPS